VKAFVVVTDKHSHTEKSVLVKRKETELVRQLPPQPKERLRNVRREGRTRGILTTRRKLENADEG
jgi:hypothetical protein